MAESYERHEKQAPSIKIISAINRPSIAHSRPSAAHEATHVIPHRETKKLINETSEFCTEQILKMLGEFPDFLVVGVLGTDGTGKSTIMSHLCGPGVKSKGEPVQPPFPIQSLDCILNGKYETTGVDITVTPDRMILLDTQAVLSASVLAEMVRCDQTLPMEAVSFENWHELQSVQMGVFLFSVCHVVLVVQDWVGDFDMWRYVRTLEMLRSCVPHVAHAVPSAASPSVPVDPFAVDEPDPSAEYVPDIVCVFNKIPDEQFDQRHIEALSRALDAFFFHSKFRKRADVSSSEIPSSSGSHNHGHSHSRSAPTQAPLLGEAQVDSLISSASLAPSGGTHVNFFMLPFQDNDDGTRPQASGRSLHHRQYSILSDELRNVLLGWQKRPFSRNMSEREWLRNAGRVWEGIKRSPLLSEYNKTLQKMQLYRI
mmetsp:Transcript_45490/g.74120  ORF Transcript_45490/g.74120 Transcript_45490/m.74120 type:complete len:427 (-) Transcript_45490:624-1904(-)|eukprot:CAMPEP_0184368988 /NCGR_PEP_ID=MMETSP1089-20130417/161988_1 /TAXON_ID=38269 ORGANISM="Gloeochaete wittrockiana, Strain SAG46.84" /NCGR_SAMPLE_ID=MMETSP1089 /ASSEMBLY_ACC=CAM_ASM_000445 /LENGTH=426 /DNA_ID=CAMNT_0026711371 /DNA_START=108 /DNA_END=1388 /DNA_ORIENTATION=+